MSVSVVEKRLRSMKYEQAENAVKAMSNVNGVTEEQKAEYQAALSNHPGNPANGTAETLTQPNAKPEAEANGEVREKVGRVWEEKLAGSGLTRDEIIDQLVAGEITPEKAKELSAQGTDGLTIFCSAKSGWICISGKGRFPANLHPELAERICNDEIKTLLAKHKGETDAALAAAKVK